MKVIPRTILRWKALLISIQGWWQFQLSLQPFMVRATGCPQTEHMRCTKTACSVVVATVARVVLIKEQNETSTSVDNNKQYIHMSTHQNIPI